MQSLAWRVLTGLNKSITISFLLVGHTKFSPDWCFGLLKQKFRRSRVDCLDDLVTVVQGSAKVNEAQLVATQEGEVLVATYNWSAHFSDKFNQSAFKGIKKFHHLRFDSAHPQCAFVRTVADAPEKKITIMNSTWKPTPQDLPPVILPAGLSRERQAYLYDKIREYCRPEVQDAVCPRPVDYEQPNEEDTALGVPDTSEQPPSKRRKCTLCQQPGHNRRSCPDR